MTFEISNMSMAGEAFGQALDQLSPIYELGNLALKAADKIKLIRQQDDPSPDSDQRQALLHLIGLEAPALGVAVKSLDQAAFRSQALNLSNPSHLCFHDGGLTVAKAFTDSLDLRPALGELRLLGQLDKAAWSTLQTTANDAVRDYEIRSWRQEYPALGALFHNASSASDRVLGRAASFDTNCQAFRYGYYASALLIASTIPLKPESA